MIMQRRRYLPQLQGGSSVNVDRIRQIDAYWRAANYLSAAQLYLRDNVLLRLSIRPTDIKPRLQGFWGIQPGLNLTYVHLNRLIQDTDASILLVIGPGHAAAALRANLFLEGTLQDMDSQMTLDEQGLEVLVRQYGRPGETFADITPSTPGVIQAGIQQGHSLSRAFGAVFDNPNLIAACVITDAEAETGPLAAAWHSTKFLNPATCGAVLPILHLSGDGQSGPAILGRMDNDELESLFAGYGYDIGIVSGDDPVQVHEAMWQAMDWAFHEIRALQDAARAGEIPDQPTWPMLVIRTAKGWTGPRDVDGLPVEGTFRAHGLPVPDPAGNPEHLVILDHWLRSYKPDELFDVAGVPQPDVLAVCPKGGRRIGRNRHADGGQLLVDLSLPDVGAYAVDVPAPGRGVANGVFVASSLLRDVIAGNADQRNFRLFSPDEIPGNHMDAVLQAADRAWLWPIYNTDESLSEDGRVMQTQSPPLCQGWLEGYLRTGRHGVLACGETVLAQLEPMLNQHACWLAGAGEVAWRKPIASLNCLTTDHAWCPRQVGSAAPPPIGRMLGGNDIISRVYLPPDANCLLCVVEQCLRSRNQVNLIVASGQPDLQWLDIKAAAAHCRRGISAWHWAGSGQEEPDVVLACAGDVPTTETLAAAWLLRRHVPDLRFRVINVVDLLTLMPHDDQSGGLGDEAFDGLFGTEYPVVFAFHGSSRVIHELLYDRPNPDRFHVHGYGGQGGTSTPFGLRLLNRMSRFDLAIAALEQVERPGDVAESAEEFRAQRHRHEQHIREYGADMPEITEWRWS